MASQNSVEHIDETAYEVNYGAHKPGIATEDVLEYYTKWAEKGTYDVDLGPQNYRGPEICADVIMKHRPDQKDMSILDVAAGTGFLGEKLKERGYTTTDGLEPAEGMLQVAKKKGIYRNYILELFPQKDTCLTSSSYDLLAISGGMGEGHIPCSALDEMVRVVKSGGLVVIVMREKYLEEVVEYRGRLEPRMKAIEEQGLWKTVEKTVTPRYSFANNGVIFVFEVTKKEE